jgi:hypothetical protein
MIIIIIQPHNITKFQVLNLFLNGPVAAASISPTVLSQPEALAAMIDAVAQVTTRPGPETVMSPIHCHQWAGAQRMLIQ